ncbi:heterokaryon incompatibility protein-domain-containing protein [Aspergillus avenaceus]|uniref:Heterokaryon incompatibility protein-domain-containing protein n=1 Tax=Aspergillus avenaceus TaxID=36643 RepID=A0A5N6TTP6_ASPAV|nr:heterokaryon incompatibility protein-domain-containing protein [Aspergillus avenaceus]
MSSVHEKVSNMDVPSFQYSALPPEPYTTRMIRLLPGSDKNGIIQCEILDYDLAKAGEGEHLYEALSYVWGSSDFTCSIILNGCKLRITESLHTALSYLRSSQLERVLWIDAVCINQKDTDEKNRQIPLMRMIYAQARRVIVWLGEACEDSDDALEAIDRFGRESQRESIEGGREKVRDACQKLLRRVWFRRIWVLQEVGVCQCISIMCGSVQIPGHIFCEGLSRLKVSLPSSVQPVVNFIRGAHLRPASTCGTLPIGELIDMYRTHDATKLHDKVYALLGLSTETMDDEASLKPNYNLQWHEVFKQVTKRVFPSSCSVETWPEAPFAVIKGRGWVLGYVASVSAVEDPSNYGRQKVNVIYNKTAQSLGFDKHWGTEWLLQASAEPVQEGNLILFFKGGLGPIIVNLCHDHFAVVVSTAITLSDREKPSCDVVPAQNDSHIQESLRDIHVTWEISLAGKESKGGPNDLKHSMSGAPQYQEDGCEEAKRLHDTSSILDGIMIEILEAYPLEHTVIQKLLEQRGESLVVSEDVFKAVAANGEEEVMRLLLEQRGESPPLSEDVIIAFAADGDDEVMQMLLEHWGESLTISEQVVKAAAANGDYGHEIMQLLFEHCDDCLPISEEVVKTAVANDFYGDDMIQLLLEHRGKTLPISEDIVKTAAASTSKGHETMPLFLEHWGKSLPMSEDVVKAATTLEWYASRIIGQLLALWGESLPIPEDILEILAASESYERYEMVEVLLAHRGTNLPISEDAVKAAAANETPRSRPQADYGWVDDGYHGFDIIQLFLKYWGDDLPISEGVVKAAAANKHYGHQTIRILFEHRGDHLPFSEEILKAAVANKSHGAEIIKQFSKHFSDAVSTMPYD